MATVPPTSSGATGSTGQLDDWQMANGNWAKSVDLGSRTPDWQIAGNPDLNGDGTDDILWRDRWTGQLDNWQMNNGNWSRSVDLGSRTPDWQIVGLGDFISGDNNADIMWRNAAADRPLEDRQRQLGRIVEPGIDRCVRSSLPVWVISTTQAWTICSGATAMAM